MMLSGNLELLCSSHQNCSILDESLSFTDLALNKVSVVYQSEGCIRIHIY